MEYLLGMDAGRRRVSAGSTSSAKSNSGDKSPTKKIIVVAFIALMVLAYFYVINNRMKSIEEDVTTVSAVQELLVKDLSTNYPNTPKEVVKMYSEITRCYYAENYSEEEFIALARMGRELFDDELVANQTEESYFRALRAEVANFKQQKRVISSYSVSSSADVQYYNYRNDEWAQLVCMYSIRTGGKIEPSKQRYLLRKDEAGHWKIFGFRLEALEQTNGENE